MIKKTKPIHSIVRQKLQGYFLRLLKIIIPLKSSQEVIKEDLQKILVVRINYRIGNVLFITPIIEQLEQEFPNAKIDVLIGAGFTKTLFTGFSNVEDIFDFPRKKLKNPIELFKYIKHLRSKKYDAVFNVNYGSSSDKFATLLARSRYKIGFCQEELFTPVTHCVQKQDNVKHASLKPLELMKAVGKKPNYALRMSIALSATELSNAKKSLEKLVDGYSYKKVIAIFRNARWEKKLEDSWWYKLVENIENRDTDILIIDILSPDVKEPLRPDILHYEEKDLRKLAAFIANLDAFVCADTGPMHLASASGVPTIALFNTTDVDSYGPIGKDDQIIDISTNMAEERVSVQILNSLN
jgi:ADP-heptose:LPS heptosyltransferase